MSAAGMTLDYLTIPTLNPININAFFREAETTNNYV